MAALVLGLWLLRRGVVRCRPSYWGLARSSRETLRLGQGQAIALPRVASRRCGRRAGAAPAGLSPWLGARPAVVA